MNRQQIPRDLHHAKQLAIEMLFNTRELQAIGPAWAVRPHPKFNVVGIGLGRKIKRGRKLRRSCVRIYVERKLARSALPARYALPSSIGDVETDVVEVGRFRAQVPLTAQTRLRPARPGCSIGFQFPEPRSGDLMAGTLGAVVQDGANARYILSNNHVLANENSLPMGTQIVQPGLLDGGSVDLDVIATLSRFVPLSATEANHVDCALARISDEQLVTTTQLPLVGRLTSPEPIDASEDMPVEKTGRATGYTAGKVFDISATVAVQFDLGILHFVDQLLIKGEGQPFSDGGDSGSLVVDLGSGRATGLILGGVPQYTIANHIGDVLRTLDVTLVC